MEKQKSNFGGFFKGLLVGAVVFGAIALFTAPQSGADTRHMLREKGEELREKGEELRVQAVETIENARAQVDTAISDVRHRSGHVAEAINPV